MGSALREIQTTYDSKLEDMRGELETYYNLKVRHCWAVSDVRCLRQVQLV